MASPSTVGTNGSDDDSHFDVTKIICARKVRVSDVRSIIVEIIKLNGGLANEIAVSRQANIMTRKTKPKTSGPMLVAMLVKNLFDLSDLLRFDLQKAVTLKQDLNEVRFPVDYAVDPKDKSEEYTPITGIGKETITKKMIKSLSSDERTVDYFRDASSANQATKWLNQLLIRSMKFVADRGWDYADSEPTKPVPGPDWGGR